jgi:glycine/D-amino acid oxidase-like deaminating enzyme
MTRRSVFGLVGLSRKGLARVAGGFADSSPPQGHQLRDQRAFPPPRRSERARIVIVGGGMAGLCAAWRLAKRGFRDFVVLEMEREAGGNSRWGENEVSVYPWAAHYVPVPSRRSALVNEIMADLGVLADGKWDERQLCHSPQERLYLHGRWQDGLEPEVGATPIDRDQVRRFHERMAEFADTGEFAVPVATGRRRRADLDRMSMADWLRAEGFHSPSLAWLVDYSCRDDYGARAADTSAWAGIHYFAARGQRDDKGPLTWPEGNGWIVRRLLERVGGQVRPASMVHRIERRGPRWRVLAGDTEYAADAVVFAAPTFTARYLMDAPPPTTTVYSPWLVANLTLDRWPEERGIPPAWDNVLYNSPSLGYVVATHQSLRTHIPRTVWTYYWALAEHSPAQGRRLLLDRDWGHWCEAILDDLGRAHPDIRQCVSRVDIMRFGHAMARPTPGRMFSPEREALARDLGGLWLANSDLSGMSIFEEAQYQGVRAAEAALARVSK